MSRTAEFDNLENPYRPPAAVRSAYGATADVQSQVDELRVFVGGKANYYLQKWAPRLQDPQAEVGMNWAAFFLTAMWMCYRKMYRVAFIFYGVTTLVVVAQYVVFVTVMGLPAIPAGVGLIGNVAAAVICGLYGNAWYLAHAERLIAEARARVRTNTTWDMSWRDAAAPACWRRSACRSPWACWPVSSWHSR